MEKGIKEHVEDVTKQFNKIMETSLVTQEVDNVIDNINCSCRRRFIIQEASCRFWYCEKHGKTGFNDVMSLVKQISDLRNITQDEAWDICEKFHKNKEEKSIDIYFCEDKLYGDLYRKFIVLGKVKRFFKKIFKI